VVVTHDLDLMYQVADKVVVLHDGGVVYFGPVSEIDQSDHPHIRQFMSMDELPVE
jgi:phospholipid/cholesterol/gamma-HCH transport system ATP-binding protein